MRGHPNDGLEVAAFDLTGSNDYILFPHGMGIDGTATEIVAGGGAIERIEIDSGVDQVVSVWNLMDEAATRFGAPLFGGTTAERFRQTVTGGAAVIGRYHAYGTALPAAITGLTPVWRMQYTAAGGHTVFEPGVECWLGMAIGLDAGAGNTVRCTVAFRPGMSGANRIRENARSFEWDPATPNDTGKFEGQGLVTPQI